MSTLLHAVKEMLDRHADGDPPSFVRSTPAALLASACYHVGTRDTAHDFQYGHTHFRTTDVPTLLAHIKVKQLQLIRSTHFRDDELSCCIQAAALDNPDTFKSAMEARMMRRMGGDALHEDPELFDEATGPIPSHPAD